MVTLVQPSAGAFRAPHDSKNLAVVVLDLLCQTFFLEKRVFSRLSKQIEHLRRLGAAWIGGFRSSPLSGNSSSRNGPPPGGKRAGRPICQQVPKPPRDTQGIRRMQRFFWMDDAGPAHYNLACFPAGHRKHSSKRNGKQIKSFRDAKPEPVTQSQSQPPWGQRPAWPRLLAG